ncbi:MAG: SusD/RagB family nutrient-binding outer membrane lipoprotein [Agriterribacter sp.]
MKITKLVILSLLFLGVSSSCQKKYDEYLQNPNLPTNVPPTLVFRGLLAGLDNDGAWSDITRWNQFDACNYNYYGNQRYDWLGAELNYLSLKDVVQMEKEAIRVGLPEANAYAAMGKFFRAFYFYRMSSLVGDLPLTDALKGLDALEPVYNSQKDIFIQIDKWLDEANNDLAAIISQSGNSKLDGDFYFEDLSSWQKTINAFRLRALIALSKREAEADLNIKQSFATVMGNLTKYPLFESNDDNLQFIYNNINKYPSNPDNLGFDATRYNMAATYLNTLVALKDPRAYITSEPATGQLKNGKTPADITAYVGANSGEDLAEMSSKMADATNAAYSLRSRSRYYSSYAPEPFIIIGYPEMCFNIAEAMHRGWVTGSAEDWYKKGIKASLSFYGVPVEAAGTIAKVYPYNTPSSVTYNIPFDFNGVYYPQTSVKYAGNTDEGLKQILTQKYLAFFQNSGWEPYFNWRRTGVPEFLTGVGTGNSGRIALRFQYPNLERITNGTNWAAAVQKQFGTTDDDINAKMWLIK